MTEAILSRSVGLPLHQGGDGEDVRQAVAGLLEQLHQILVVGHLVVEVGEHGAEGQLRPSALVEVVGVREQIALQAADAAQILVVDEVVVLKDEVLGGLGQILHRSHLVLRQQLDDLADRVALGDGHVHRHGGAALGPHPADERHVVHLRVQGESSLGNLLIAVVDPAEQAEEPFVLNKPLLLEGGGHLLHVVAGDLLH